MSCTKMWTASNIPRNVLFILDGGMNMCGRFKGQEIFDMSVVLNIKSLHIFRHHIGIVIITPSLDGEETPRNAGYAPC
jgi:hypothetical protein